MTILIILVLVAIGFMFARMLRADAAPITPTIPTPVEPRFTLTWSDEFDAPAGTAPDDKKWAYNTGGEGWGNNELQTYTDRRENSYHDGQGNLVIRVNKETFTGPDGNKRDYTSARLLTKGKFTQKYGRFEARIKMPLAQGIWPAFWMLGDDIDQVGWSKCGEIDIMENPGNTPTINYGSLHGPGYEGGNALTAKYTLPEGKKFCDDFHVYAIELEPNVVRFYVDGELYSTRTPADTKDKQWVYDHPFFMLMNVAVGGNSPGNPDDKTTFPQMMLIDYVRVYSLTQ